MYREKGNKWRENVIESILLLTANNSLWMNKNDSEVLSNENDETDSKRKIRKYWHLLKMIKKLPPKWQIMQYE